MPSPHMHRAARLLLVFTVVALAPLPAAAAGFGLFQHGGRGAAQVGALTGRADDPSALTYNPAGITRLKGGQLQAGLDFGVAEDDFRDVTGSYSATHHINFPPALYLTYGPRKADSGWAVGLGLDAPFWNTNDWQPALFPRATSSRKWTVEIFELHPVLAYAVDERWSFAVGFRYLRGELEDAHRTPLAAIFAPDSSFVVFGEHSSQADVDGWGYDFALHYDQPSWGWGAVLRGEGRGLEPERDARRGLRAALAGGRGRDLGGLPREPPGPARIRDSAGVPDRLLGRTLSGAAPRAGSGLRGLVGGQQLAHAR